MAGFDVVGDTPPGDLGPSGPVAGEVAVSVQAAYAPITADPAVEVTVQAGYTVLVLNPAVVVTEQFAYVALVEVPLPPPPTPVVRRRQYVLR